MTQVKTTLVLGAGASRSSGYPVGLGLRRAILGWERGEKGNVETVAEELSVGRNELRNFLDEFRHAQTYSIDAFLGRRKSEFERVGKRSIARVLLRCENEDVLFEEQKDDHWYQYLVNLLTAHDWDSFDASWLSVVSFNYDRSLEWFLCRSLQSTYGKSQEEVLEKLKALEIVHVYGCLGLPWDPNDGIPYALEQSHHERAIPVAADRIRVIPEGRDDDPCVLKAQQVLNDAQRVCFLGFGYDETNLRRLGAPKSLTGITGMVGLS